MSTNVCVRIWECVCIVSWISDPKSLSTLTSLVELSDLRATPLTHIHTHTQSPMNKTCVKRSGCEYVCVWLCVTNNRSVESHKGWMPSYKSMAYSQFYLFIVCHGQRLLHHWDRDSLRMLVVLAGSLTSFIPFTHTFSFLSLKLSFSSFPQQLLTFFECQHHWTSSWRDCPKVCDVQFIVSRLQRLTTNKERCVTHHGHFRQLSTFFSHVIQLHSSILILYRGYKIMNGFYFQTVVSSMSSIKYCKYINNLK